MKYIGIDLGLAGAIHITDEQGNELETYKMPLIGKVVDYNKLYQLLSPFEGFNGILGFEKLGVIFGSSKKTAFTMGYQSGILEGICICLSIPYITIPAKVWQANLFEGITKIQKVGKTSTDTKKMALIACQRLFPNKSLIMTDRSTKPHEGVVDAILITEYLRRKHKK